MDLSNSPHPLLFTPIRVAFEEEGRTVLMTARDNAQTLELARQRWPDVKPIGGRSPGGQRWTTSTNLRTTSHFGSRTASSLPDGFPQNFSAGKARARRMRDTTRSGQTLTVGPCTVSRFA